MNFGFDPKKSESNLSKHGIDFDVAQQLWNNPDLLEISTKVVDEPRYLVIAKIGKNHWSAVITYRDETIRLISVRRSRQEEIELYES